MLEGFKRRARRESFVLVLVSTRESREREGQEEEKMKEEKERKEDFLKRPWT